MIKNYLIDIDGVICEDVANEASHVMPFAKEITGAKKWINEQYDEGHYVCFFTARTEAMRSVTETWLKDHGFMYHQIIFGKPRGGNYHYVDNLAIRATKFNGKFTPLVKKQKEIEVFDEALSNG